MNHKENQGERGNEKLIKEEKKKEGERKRSHIGKAVLRGRVRTKIK